MPAPAIAASPHNTPRRSQPIRCIVSSHLLVVRHPRIRMGFETRVALLGFLGNPQSAGAGNAIDGGGPPEDRLGADRRTAYMFGHSGAGPAPGEAATAARSRQGSPEHAPGIVTFARRGSLVLSSIALAPSDCEAANRGWLMRSAAECSARCGTLLSRL